VFQACLERFVFWDSRIYVPRDKESESVSRSRTGERNKKRPSVFTDGRRTLHSVQIYLVTNKSPNISVVSPGDWPTHAIMFFPEPTTSVSMVQESAPEEPAVIVPVANPAEGELSELKLIVTVSEDKVLASTSATFVPVPVMALEVPVSETLTGKIRPPLPALASELNARPALCGVFRAF